MRTAIPERVARHAEQRRCRKIAGMVRTAARMLSDVDFRSGAASVQQFGRYDYNSDPALRAIVMRLFDDPAVGRIHIPHMAVKRYSDGKDD